MKTIAISLLSLILFGCSSTQKVSQTETVIPDFDWNPPSQATPGAAGVTFAVVGGSYAEDSEDWASWPFDTFARNMGQDFNELLTGRGFTTTGPFEHVDEMTFPDKKACDLILEPTLDVKLGLQNLQAKQHSPIMTAEYFTLVGTAVVSGRVTLSVLESLSGTRMWNKSIEIDRISVPWESDQRFSQIPAMGQGINVPLESQPTLKNALAGPLERAYDEILGKAWTYLDPEEMAVVKTQAMEVKQKTTFSGNK